MTARRKKWTTMLVVAGATMMAIGLSTLLASLSAFVPFELGPGVGTDEGGLTNILGDGNAGNGPDWADIFGPTGNVVDAFGGVASFVQDDVSAGSATDATVYSGGPADKNSDLIEHWTWSTSSVPAKDDLTNVYAYSKTVSGHMIIYVGVEREDPSGASHIDVEFYQDTISLSEPAPCDAGQCTFIGENTNGDLLANLDFTQGGAFGSLSIRKRDDTKKNNYELIAELDAQGCEDVNGDDTVCAFTNGGSIDGGPWPNFDNHGAPITNLLTNSFTEFGVDVTALFGTNPCFATIQVKTRSSHSFTATLKDWALKNFASCNATAATTIHNGPSVGATHVAADIQGTTIPVLSTIHDRVVVSGTAGFPAPTGNVTFRRYPTANCSGTPVDQVVALTPLAGTSNSAAESESFQPGPGSVSYRVVYAGDTNYPTGAIADCEPLTISKFNSAVTTDIRTNAGNAATSVLNKAVDISGADVTVYDVATITGNGSGPDPTGSVTFRRFTSGNCSGTFNDETVNITADQNPNDGIATAVSGGHILNTAAGQFLSFMVVYNGDTNYNQSAASKCEPLCAFPFVP